VKSISVELLDDKSLKHFQLIQGLVKYLKEGMKVLAAYDGSENAKRAVAEAAELAKQFSGSLTVLHVYWDPSESAYAGELGRTEGIEVRDEASLRVLDDIEPMLKEAGVDYEFRSEVDPNPPKAIMRIAENEGYDCISMGSRGRGGARAWLLGSVSSKVIAESNCPVIVVK